MVAKLTPAELKRRVQSLPTEVKQKIELLLLGGVPATILMLPSGYKGVIGGFAITGAIVASIYEERDGRRRSAIVAALKERGMSQADIDQVLEAADSSKQV